HAHFARNWQDIAASFLKLGVTAYGGPAIMGIMQAELQDKRQWVSKERFVEGLSLVNMLPGAGATQLGIFLGYARGGWWGGLLAVSLVQMAPHALPDPLALAMLLATVSALLMWRIGVVKMMLAGSVFGVLRSRLWSLPGVQVAFSLYLWVGI